MSFEEDIPPKIRERQSRYDKIARSLRGHAYEQRKIFLATGHYNDPERIIKYASALEQGSRTDGAKRFWKEIVDDNLGKQGVVPDSEMIETAKKHLMLLGEFEYVKKIEMGEQEKTRPKRGKLELIAKVILAGSVVALVGMFSTRITGNAAGFGGEGSIAAAALFIAALVSALFLILKKRT